MSQDTKSKQISLKEILASLRETNSLLAGIEGKLEFLATNSPMEEAKEIDLASGENPTLDALNAVKNSLGRRASNISKATNTIVGS